MAQQLLVRGTSGSAVAGGSATGSVVVGGSVEGGVVTKAGGVATSRQAALRRSVVRWQVNPQQIVLRQAAARQVAP